MKIKSFLNKKLGVFCAAVIFLGLGANALYSAGFLPYPLENGTPTDSAEFNADIEYLEQLIEEKNALLKSLVPAGTVLSYSGEKMPNGFYECDGREVSREEHPELFAAIEVMYGEGDGSSTFNIPDYRGYFLRGFDNGVGRDPDTDSRLPRPDGVGGDAVGTIQVDQFENHRHFQDGNPGYSRHGGGGTGDNDFAVREKSRTETSGGNETRPENVAIVYIIKAR